MKLQSLKCPNCDGMLNMDLEKMEHIFCPYCGQKFSVDDGKKEYTINQNININKNITHTKLTYNEADVIREKTNSVSKYLKNVINKKDEENKNVAILLDKNIKPPFKGKEKTDKNRFQMLYKRYAAAAAIRLPKKLTALLSRKRGPSTLLQGT